MKKSNFDRLWQKYQGGKHSDHSKQDHSGKNKYMYGCPNQSQDLKISNITITMKMGL